MYIIDYVMYFIYRTEGPVIKKNKIITTISLTTISTTTTTTTSNFIYCKLLYTYLS